MGVGNGSFRGPKLPCYLSEVMQSARRWGYSRRRRTKVKPEKECWIRKHLKGARGSRCCRKNTHLSQRRCWLEGSYAHPTFRLRLELKSHTIRDAWLYFSLSIFIFGPGNLLPAWHKRTILKATLSKLSRFSFSSVEHRAIAHHEMEVVQPNLQKQHKT